jgi:TIGR03009 family protein
MRRFGTLALMLATGTFALAQQPVKAPSASGVVPAAGSALPVVQAKAVAPDAKTLAHLVAWEKSMGDVKEFYAEATRTVTDKLRLSKKVYSAPMWLSKPSLLRVDLNLLTGDPKNPKQLQEMFISNGKTFYHYDLVAKERNSASLTGNASSQLLMLQLMAGLTTKEITERFTVKTLLEDENFVYLGILPVMAEDKENFQAMKLTLCGAKFAERAYIPRRIEMEDGKTLDVWDFPDPKVNPKGIEPEKTFKIIDIPKDWADKSYDAPKTTTKPMTRPMTPLK